MTQLIDFTSKRQHSNTIFSFLDDVCVKTSGVLDASVLETAIRVASAATTNPLSAALSAATSGAISEHGDIPGRTAVKRRLQAPLILKHFSPAARDLDVEKFIVNTTQPDVRAMIQAYLLSLTMRKK